MSAVIPIIEQTAAFVRLGGAIMAPLLALGVAMWTALLLRWLELWLGWRGSMAALLEASAAPRAASQSARRGALWEAARGAHVLTRAWEPGWRLRAHFERARRQLRLGRVSTEAMIAAAPLLGLLGTLTGMIDTFEVLGAREQAGYAEAMARGISKALITTELGLTISIPGILVSRALRRREARLERALDELEARFKARALKEPRP